MESSIEGTIKILFVDDEPRVLDGLRRMLRNRRHEWTMQFCDGPLAALELLAKEKFDVVVSDMRMPVMDGAELLTRIREQYPEVVRIILSGQSEHERILRAVGPAHQFLSKPCEPESLRATIVKACHIGKRMNNPLLRQLASKLTVLPSIPSLYMRLIKELNNDECSLSTVSKLISQDLGMTAKLLQLVNSSFFGLPVHVVDVNHAAALLGTNTIKQLVLAAGIFRQFDESPERQLLLRRLLHHSMAVASIAKRLAKFEDAPSEVVDNVFIAGVLHDIGKVVLAANVGADYTKVFNDAETKNNSTCEPELETYGASHADVGGHLLSLWGFPQEIIGAVAFHHDPSCSTDQQFTPLTAVHVANRFCRWNHIGDVDTIGVDSEYLKRVGLAGKLQPWKELAVDAALAGV